MKIVKLLGIFAVILGAVVAILCWPDDVTGGPDIGRNNSLKVLNDEVESKWKEQTDWNAEFYNTYFNKIKMMGNKYNVTTLRNYHTSQAITIIHKKIFEQWSLPGCNSNIVKHYKNALNVVCNTDKDGTNHPLAQEISAVYGVYSSALTLATSNFVPASGFNGSTWKNFSSYANDQKQAVRNMLSNNTYRTYLGNITAIRNGLNGAANRIDQARAPYYNKLANEIISYYTNVPRTDANLQKLRDVRNRYGNEFSGNYSVDEFASRFNREVQQQANTINF